MRTKPRRKINPAKGDQRGESYIARLRTMPDQVFRETVERLARGEKLRPVASWLVTQDRGGLQHVGVHTLRKYLDPLRDRIAEQKRQKPLIDPRILVKEIQTNERKLDNDAAIQGVDRPKEKVHRQKLDDLVGDVIDKINAKLVLTVAYIKTVDEIDFYRSLRQKMPVPLGGTVKCLAELRRIGESFIKLESQSPCRTGEDGGSIGAACPGNIALDNLTLQEQELQQKARAMSPASRMFAGETLDIMFRTAATKEEIEKLETQHNQHTSASEMQPGRDR